jgi:hypothetical protein
VCDKKSLYTGVRILTNFPFANPTMKVSLNLKKKKKEIKIYFIFLKKRSFKAGIEGCFGH